MTVADLKRSGAVALGDAALKQLVVGKSIWVVNTVTGEKFKVVYDPKGQSIIYHVGNHVPQPSEVGDLAQNGYSGTSTAYSIKDGKIVTELAGTPFEVAVYKQGDNYRGARSNEFGYANYEIIPPPENMIDIGKEVHVPPEADRGEPD
jgi:hypothetical protein